MEFLEPKCSVLGLCRSVASVASIAWILAALARGNDGASAIATALAGLQGLQELTVGLGYNQIGPGAQCLWKLATGGCLPQGSKEGAWEGWFSH